LDLAHFQQDEGNVDIAHERDPPQTDYCTARPFFVAVPCGHGVANAVPPPRPDLAFFQQSRSRKLETGHPLAWLRLLLLRILIALSLPAQPKSV
jgi:hypothetical protein